MIKQNPQWMCLALAVLVLAGCMTPASGGRRAPVMEYGAGRQPVAAIPAPDKRPVMDSEYEAVKRFHVVQKGDTLYSIAFVNGVDYRDMAEWNRLDDPAAIKIGQRLEIRVPVSGSSGKDVPMPLMASQVPDPIEVKSYPKVGKLAYTEQALARAEQLQKGPVKARPVKSAEASPPVPVKYPLPAPRPENDSPLQWQMPARGSLISGFSEGDNRKGVDIAGMRGQPIQASEAGKVVYSGSGLRGYGKLVIIKHNATYLSAYAHNDKIMVKEGQNVSKGQKIAEMGSSDADRVKLHFEIRKMGKPVDPAKYLPLAKS
ncbi:MAG: peptidoglycan DD-metalloendopeptidase family protein [Gammaproteobacteria bacterium]|nr:peptidoglycan DD-metalloendopeptidase family protein [Gammaproteobacteria bacterium]MBU1775760.1 peptidoglycan DD-metalloendopeptidase family protein [Gammaproteobacteria bacterium]MBU1970001.1 peptidoglycan DD-metalloendopeptidase family protein [Gammaproteobacteria bacterium]